MKEKELQKTVYQLFREQCRKNPDKTALTEYAEIGTANRITYGELFHAVDVIAKVIEDMVKKDYCAIGVYGERSIPMVISIMAILKSGNYFVPMNRDYSKEYLDTVVKDAELELILSNDSAIEQYNLISKDKIIYTDKFDFKINKDIELAEDRSLSSIPLFVLFTSGTSGMPKGVVHNQRQIMNYCHYMWKLCNIKDTDTICQRTRLEYIPAMWELFGGLLIGMKVVILSDLAAINPVKTLEAAIAEKISVIQGIPSFLERMFRKKELIEKCNFVRMWITVGEPAKKHLLDAICSMFPNASFIADYGTTELGGVLQYTRKDYEENNFEIPWYLPIDNVRITIRNEENKECGIEEEGVLCVEGVCVAERYLTTKRKEDNHTISNLDGENRFYITGDVAIRQKSGSIRIIGRKDKQVKIGGVRVELEVIENVLKEMECVKEAVVQSMTKKSGVKQIVAFVVVHKKNRNMNLIKGYLEERLPTIYVPNQIVFLDQIPYLYNGKIDSKNLEQKWSMQNEYGKMIDEINMKSFEKELILIASEILETDPKNIDPHNTFKRNGFDSLLMVDFLDRINEKFCFSLMISDLYEYSSISKLEKKMVEDRDKCMQENHTTPLLSEEPKIAVIGMSGRFPDAQNIDEYWSNLKTGRDSIQEIPFSRWNRKKYRAINTKERGKTVCEKGGFLEEVENFDYSFFNISKKEAIFMEPQLRILLEESYRGLEDAGYYREKLEGNQVGVFIGAGKGDYIDLLHDAELEYEPFATTGCDSAMMASRISNYFNLTGPCMTIDSACASSLIAVHLGAKAILDGNCSMAITGGVHIMNTPKLYLKSSGMNILADDGVCKAFDKDGHGFVPGEGVGIVILKEFNQAVQDCDHIYAVIRGSNMNQNGETDSITAPSPSSQKELLLSTYASCHVNPEEISYVEAHGTGTQLGDPIELSALEYAFRQFTDRKQYCAIGSVKTNIGHGITNAGVAGFIKAVLSVNHNFIPRTLHCTIPNPLFHFEESPFYVSMSDRVYPTGSNRIAAISSFGLNGSNCHMVVEAYDRIETRNQDDLFYIFPFSAKTDVSLRKYLKKFSEWLKSEDRQHFLCDIAYTLQVRRKHYSSRVAFAACSVTELADKINAYLFNHIQVWDNVPKELLVLAESYCNGETVLWNACQKECCTVSIPKYEFERCPCWYTEIGHRRTSELAFKKIREEEYCLSLSSVMDLLWQHEIFEQAILPASFMLSAVVELMYQKEGTSSIEIKSFQFKRLYPIDDKHNGIIFSLQKHENGYAISIFDERMEAESFAEGVIAVLSRNAVLHPEPDLFFAEEGMTKVFEGKRIYEEYKKRNIFYGKAYQRIEKIWCGENQLLTQLKDGDMGYGSEMDNNQGFLEAAMHAVMGFNMVEEDLRTYVPIYVESVRFINYLEKPRYAYIKVFQKADGLIECESVILLDKNKEILVVMEHVILKAARWEPLEGEPENEIIYSVPEWVEETIQKKGEDTDTVLLFFEEQKEKQALEIGRNRNGRTICIRVSNENRDNKKADVFYQLTDFDKNLSVLFHKLKEEIIPFEQIVYLGADKQEDTIDVEAAVKNQVEPVRKLVSFLIKNLMDHKIRLLLCYQEQKELSVMINHAMQGFLRTAHIENNFFEYRIVGVGSEMDFVTPVLNELQEHSEIEVVRYVQDTRFIQKIEDISMEPVKKYSYHGVYLITGGLGTIGFWIARYLVSISDSVIILLGRSDYKHDQEKAARMEELKKYGNEISYYCVDVSCQKELQDVVNEIHKRYSKITGLIHCAGIINDSLLINKTEEEFYLTVRAKALGVYYLSQALREDQMELMVLCSSMAAVKGKAGQSDYAFANGFLDAYAQFARIDKAAEQVVSINWPLWKNTTMKFSEDGYRQYKKEGYLALNKEEGIKTLDNVINLSKCQVIVEKRIVQNKQEIQKAVDILTAVEKKEMKVYTRDEILQICKRIFEEQLLEDGDVITAQTEFSDMGITSLNVFDILDELEIYFGILPKTILYTVRTLEQLTEHLFDKCQKEFERAAGTGISTGEQKMSAEESNSIVIVGVAGRYPMADSVEELWTNLISEKDCITEIPKERWDESQYFEKDTKEEGKHYAKWGGFLSNIKNFDNLFFHISAKEAVLMDPQERLFLEVVWELLESAGYKASNLNGKKVAVYVGVMWSQYQLYGTNDDIIRKPKSIISSIANRISYFFNLRGASVAIDTMCSSSLTAVYMAQNALLQGEAEFVIAGGVNLMTHPVKYNILCQERFASSDGRCRSFGKDGDGYVPGEGVGAILLTREDLAKKNHMHIYAILKGCAINHGGKTNGYTVPSPVAQSEVILDALEKSKVNPEQISYMEAHGTGTALGDPIEIEGITRAFKCYTDKKQFCPIGSLKSNIGHLESASTIASITKILLQMKYGMIVPSIHAKPLNPHINFSESPVYVQTELKEWITEKSSNGQRIPRMAGISSFGAGGSNGFLLLEEYQDIKTYDLEDKPNLFIISAQSDEQLVQLAEKHKTFLSREIEKGKEAIPIQNIAYTLQVGREEYEKRLAIVAEGYQQLIDRLNQYLNGQSCEGVYYAAVSAGIKTDTYSELKNLRLEQVLKQEDLYGLADSWTHGMQIEWENLYDAVEVETVSLPCYPFRKDSHWIVQGQEGKGRLASFVNENLSSKEEPRFRVVFDRSDERIHAHRIGEKAVVPGSVILETVCEAAHCYYKKKVFCMKEIVWSASIEMNIRKRSIDIIFLEYEDEIRFVLKDADQIQYAKGVIGFYTDADKKPFCMPQTGAVKEVRKEKDIYECFHKRNLNYDVAYRTLEEVSVYEEYSVAVLKTDFADVFQGEYIWLPNVLDGIFQAVTGFDYWDSDVKVPVSIGQIKVYQSLAEVVKIFVRKQGSGYAITAVDGEDNIVTTIEDFRLKRKNTGKKGDSDILLLEEKWTDKKVIPVALESSNQKILLLDKENIYRENIDCETVIRVVNGTKFEVQNHNVRMNFYEQEDYIKLFDWLAKVHPGVNRLIYHTEEDCFQNKEVQKGERYTYLKPLFYLAKSLENRCQKMQWKCLLSYQGKYCRMAADPAAAFWRCKYSENENHSFTCVASYQKLEWQVLRFELDNFTKNGCEIYYDKDCRKEREIAIANSVTVKDDHVYRDGEVYLITGGTGRIARIIAEDMMEKAACTVILIGRKRKEEIELPKCKKGAIVKYVQADVSSYPDLCKAYQWVKDEYNHIDGVIHCAGVLNDGLLKDKEEKQLEMVLAPKVDGLIWLSSLTEQDHLKFFVCFSSVAALIGSKGQTDYAYANRFMDSFVRYGNLRLTEEGKTPYYYSIDWSIWKDGAMKMPHFVLNHLKKTSGLESLDTKKALRILEYALLAKESVLGAIQGKRESLLKWIQSSCNFKGGVLEEKKTENVSQVALDTDMVKNTEISEELVRTLKRLISQTTEVPIERISEKKDFEEYGIDSIMMMELGEKLNQILQIEEDDIFIKNHTIEEVCEYLFCKKLIPDRIFEKDVTERKEGKQGRKGDNQIKEPIAIIGMACKFPNANNLIEFRENLIKGENCITKRLFEMQTDFTCEEQPPLVDRYGGFLADRDCFDPLFFHIAPSAVEHVSLHVKIGLEVVWHALEDAGISRRYLMQLEKENKRVGVFVGCMEDSNREKYSGEQHQSPHEEGNWSIANRISHFLNITGPSLVVDSACSSSITALHLAVQSLQNRECEIAIIGGMNLNRMSEKYNNLQREKMLSSYEFSPVLCDGDGYLPGEGAGILVLRRLENAKENGNKIYGTIKKTCVLHSGKTKAYKVPSEKTIYNMLNELLSEENSTKLSYIELASNGNTLTEQAELEAIRRILEEKGDAKQIVVAGSVKSLIGHLEGASGISQMIKVALQLKDGGYFPSVNRQVMNQVIDVTPYHLCLCKEYVEKKEDKVSLAVVNSIGAGGTYGSVLMESYPYDRELRNQPLDKNYLLLSAKEKHILKSYSKEVCNYLENHPEVPLRDVSDLLMRREAFECRLAIIADTREQCIEALRRYDTEEETGEDVLACYCETNREYKEITSRTELEACVRAWGCGDNFNWETMVSDTVPDILIPHYPFEHEEHYNERKKIDDDLVQMDGSREENILKDIMKEELARILKTKKESIKEHAALEDYGVTSIEVLEFKERLSARLTETISLNMIYQNFTIQTLTKALLESGILCRNEKTVPMLESKGGIEDKYELSEEQIGIWVAQNMYPDTSCYNLGGAYYIDSHIEAMSLERAANQVINHHPILKARIIENEDGIYQYIQKDVLLKIRTIDCQGMNGQEITALLEEKKNFSFDLEQAMLVRGYLFLTGRERNILLFCFHHVIFDYLSADIFWMELEHYYFYEKTILCEEEYKFGQYVLQEQSYLNSGRARLDKKYFEDILETNDFEAGIETGIENRSKYIEEVLDVSDKWIFGFEKNQFGNHVTLASVFTGLYQLTISILNNRESVITGIPVSLRKAEYKQAIGCYINMMLLKTCVSKEMTLHEFFQKVHCGMLDALEHANYPVRLLEHALKEKGIQYKELITYSIYYKEHHHRENLLCQEDALPIHQRGEYPFILEVRNHGNYIQAWIRYDANRFSKEDVLQFKQIFGRCQEAALRGNNVTLKEIMISQKNMEENYIVSQFIQQVTVYPQKVALVYQKKRYSYKELYQEVRRLEHFLKAEGMKLGDRAGVCLKRSEDCVMILLAIQWIGAVYIPIDTKMPRIRVEAMAEEACVKFLIVNTNETEKEKIGYITYINLHNSRKKSETISENEKMVNPEKVYIDSNDTAYIIFTSGTTGKPKGIMVSHKNLEHFLRAVSKVPGCSEKDYLLALTTTCFDISILELLLPIITGATVEVLPDDVIRDGIKLLDCMQQSKPTIVQATPTTWKMLLEAGWTEKMPLKILIGGEGFSEDLKNQLLKLCDQCWNMYGPTETTIWSMMCRLKEEEEISLGVPIGETLIRVLDDKKGESGIDEIGEIYIGGKGVSKGYLNQEEETQERFIQLPMENGREEIFYKTGDLGKILPNGTIQYVGRADFQVKRNGYRIELEEIKNAITKSDLVKEVEVFLHKEREKEDICAFLILKPDVISFGWKKEIESEIAKILPEYMLPNRIIAVERFPVTVNMKVDIKYLSHTPYHEIIKRYGEAGRNEEKRAGYQDKNEIRNFLKEQISKISGTDIDNLELDEPIGSYGLSSLEFTRLCSAINRKLSLKMNATLFYTHSTIRAIEAYLRNQMVSDEVMYADKEQCDDVAIIGISGVFPGCDDVDAFWKKLLNGENMITEIPADRWERGKLSEELKESPNYGGFINNLFDFDEALFGISPAEASIMDPQQRIMLSVVWTLFENAGYSYPDICGTDIGVFIGATGADYGERVMQEEHIDSHMLSGMVNAIIANRISYCFNLLGPSEVIETACSSSLVAVCHAVESITSGQCTMAIAGGVNVILSPVIHGALHKSRMLSPDGQCKTFDRDANGYVRGEGCAAILLKSLKQAKEDQDQIYAVIKGHSMNHGGKTNSLTAPNGKQQKELIIRAMKKAKLNPYAVGYIETHGTGTVLGDPIEVKAIQEAYSELQEHYDGESSALVPCGIGSVKTNIGHLEAAAGIAGLIKVVLALYHKQIPASQNLEVINPYLELDEMNFRMITKKTGFERYSEKEPLAGAVSSFGFGGTNAHVVLTEFCQEQDKSKQNLYNVFVLSAKDESVLKTYVERWRDFLKEKLERKEEADLNAMCYVLQTGRTEFPQRIAVIVSSLEELSQQLKVYQNGQQSDNLYHGSIIKKYCDMDIENSIYGQNREELQKLAQQWVQGRKIQWKKLYDDKVPGKINLPTYPFHMHRYGIPNKTWKSYDNARLVQDIVPTESLEEGLVFQAVLKEENTHVSHHVLDDMKILPCAIYIEMMQEAYRKLVPDVFCQLQNFRIYCPLYLKEQNETKLKLVCTVEQQKIRIRIYYEGILQCEAVASKQTETGMESFSDDEIFSIDEEDEQSDGLKRSKKECYQMFSKEAGLLYGPFYQTISQAVIKEDSVYAFIETSPFYHDVYQNTVLNPAIIDGILQCAGLFYQGTGEQRVPVLIKNLKVHAPLTAQKYLAVVKKTENDNISCQLKDWEGNVYVTIEGYQSRPVRRPKEEKNSLAKKYIFGWKKAEGFLADDSRKLTNTLVLYGDHASFIVDSKEDSNIYMDVSSSSMEEYEWERRMEEIRTCLKDDRIQAVLLLAVSETFVSDTTTCVTEKTKKEGFYLYLHVLRMLMQLDRSELSVYVLTNQVFDVCMDEIVPTHSFLTGLSQVAETECSKHKFFCIDWDKNITALYSDNWRVLANIMNYVKKSQLPVSALRGHDLYQRKLVLTDTDTGKTALKKKGVYVVLGAGGIGTALSKYLAVTYAATVILVGRSKLAEAQDYGELSAKKIVYVQSDAANKESLETLFDFVETKYKRIDGIFSCMMVLKYEKITKWTEKIMEEIFYPKVNGSIMLYETIKERNIGFWVIFSSICSFLPTIGQAGYASACAFQDSFAAFCQKRLSFPVKLLNWSYWGDDGHVAESIGVQRLSEIGMRPIYTRQGFSLLEQCLGQRENNFIIMNASDSLLKELFLVDKKENTEEAAISMSGFERLEEYSSYLLLDYFRKHGLMLEPKRKYAITQIRKELRVIPKYYKLMDAMLEILSLAGFIQLENETAEVLEKAVDASTKEKLMRLEEDSREFVLEYEKMKPYMRLLQNCFLEYDTVLSGKKNYIEVLFTNGTKEMVSGIYSENPVAHQYTEEMVKYVAKYIETYSKKQKIKILEIGAGTGGTSAAVLKELKEYEGRIQYFYTDISLSFLKYARKKFSNYDYVTYQLLDIEKNVQKQNFGTKEFDLILCSDVIHAVSDIENALESIRLLLKEDGIWLLNEITRFQNFSTLTFGLTDGWWSAKDSYRIKGSAMLDVPTWEKVLEKKGFHIIYKYEANEVKNYQTLFCIERLETKSRS